MDEIGKTVSEAVEENMASEDNETAQDSEDVREGGETDNGENYEESVDYAELAIKDMEELTRLFPNLMGRRSVMELDNPLRYAQLRDLGLTPKEAYLATAEPTQRYDHRSHLTSAVPRGAGAVGDVMTSRELEAARELFAGLSDREIKKLYNKVTK